MKKAAPTHIEDHKRTKALSVGQSELELIVSTIPALVWSAAPDGSAEFFNQQYVAYVGLSLEHLQGSGWTAAVHPDDLSALISAWQSIRATGKAGEAEARLRRKDGEYRWFLFRANPVRNDCGSLVKWIGINTDIEDRKRVEQALAASQHHLEAFMDTIPSVAWSARPDGCCDYLNERWLHYTGMTAEKAQGWGWGTAIHPDDLNGLVEYWQSCLASGRPVETEARIRRHDGEYRRFLIRGNPLHDERGKIVKWYGISADIEDRKRTEEALRQSEERVRMIVDSIEGLIATTTPEGEVEYLNKQVLDYFGRTLEELKNWSTNDAIHPDDLPRVAAVWKQSVENGEPYDFEERLRRADGEYRWFRVRGRCVRDILGHVVRWYVLFTDIDEAKRAEAELKRAYDSFADGQRLSQTGNFTADIMADDHIWSAELYRIFEFDPATKISVQMVRDVIHPEDLPSFEARFARSLGGADFDLVYRIVTPSGKVKHIHSIGRVIERVAGRPLFIGAIQDVTERQTAEEALRQSEKRARLIVDSIEALVMTATPKGEIETVNKQVLDYFGKSLEELRDWRTSDAVHPDDLPRALSLWMHSIETGEAYHFEQRLRRADGAYHWFRVSGRSLRDLRGDVVRWYVLLTDIEEGKRAEEALNKARSELAHVARVTTLNALTASIAHEVNQPLSGIVTNASTCLRMLNSDPPNVEGARETARRTVRDGNRASDVVIRLRALFSKKELAVEPMDLSDATREVIALSSSELQRNRVILRAELADDLPPVTGDRVQLQQVILNLLRNASDAMATIEDRPRELLIRTEKDGDKQARLSVKDVGVGFAPQAAEKLFEAFHSTKKDGMGIGLSISRSIIEAHHGQLWAIPNDGPGATFSFSIPCGTDTKVQ